MNTLLENPAAAMPVNAPMIPRVTRAQFAEKYFSRKIPAIVTDATADWGMSGQWSPEYLLSLIGAKPVTVSISANGKFSYDPSGKKTSDSFSEQTMSFAEAARQIATEESGRQLYVMQQSIPLKFPELMREIRVPQWVPNVNETSINLWFGRSSVTPLHYDATNNFFAQQYGEKHFTIFSPGDTPHVYPHPIDSKMAHLSSVDLDNPDLRAHPNFSLARPIRFTVHPGELLFLPAFWWHQVRSPGVSTSVSIWWMPDLQQYVQAPNGPRKLYKQYETDRLSSLKKTLLTSNRLSFSTAAALVLSAGRKWAACLLSLAACDEYVGKLAGKHNLPRTPGCNLHQLAGELRETLRKLAVAGVPANTLPPPSALEAIITLAGRVAQGSDAQFSTEEIGSIIKLAATLEQRAV
ncbi:MAG TPA: cupin-like domain-containing protein [Thermoanaerobaculia bacterium]|nr:cupin-like domain-containing protein [Thermoanaerobaculia bacterium]